MITTAPRSIAFEPRPVAELSREDLDRMYTLMARHYRKTNRMLFEADLATKDLVGLLRDEDGWLQGFTTIALIPLDYRGRKINIVFSGDTIIAPAYWGSQELVRGFCHTVGRLRARHPGRELYWLLISKGHRTYLYLPLFTKRYYPALATANGDRELADLTDFCARRLFPDSWQANEGVLRFPESRGELCEDLARGTYEKRGNRHVAFFLERNPNFFRGEELVCLTELTPENLKSVARRHLLLGMQDEG